jgi:hypothetical protein
MPKVFISYRRGDTGGQTGRLLDALERRFGGDNFFRDIEGLEPGVDFPEALNRALTECDAMLVMIGPTWSTVAGRQGRRLEVAGDFVRLEVATGLARKDVRVYPVLVGGATIPAEEELPEDLRALHRRNAIELSETRWDYDVKRLGDSLAKQLGLRETATPVTETGGRQPIGKWAMVAGAVALLLVVGLSLRWWLQKPSPPAQASSSKNVSATLHFDTDYPAGSTAHFIEQNPEPKDNSYGEVDNDLFSKRYRADVIFPTTSPPYFNALVTKVIPKDGSHEGARQGYSQMCLQPTNPITSVSKIDIAVECKGPDCQFLKATPDLVKSCGSSAPKPTSSLFSLPVVRAAERPATEQAPVWNVPTLRTLETTPNVGGSGYTKFQVQLPPNPALQGYNELSYQVLVNGERVYFDGLPPEVLREPFHPGSMNTVSFALENLNFSGQDAGFEKVTLQLTFYGQNKTQHQEINLNYVALRPMPEPFAAGSTVTSTDVRGPYSAVKWNAEYRVPKPNPNEFDVFIGSASQASGAMSMKNRFDKRSLKREGRPLVAVVRPPFKANAHYGMVAGIVQPSGQIQFTFNQSDACSVIEWLKTNAMGGSGGISPPYPFNLFTNKQVYCPAQKP